MDDTTDFAATIHMDLRGLQLAYKTTSDALSNWRGGDPEEQNLLASMKQQLYAALMDHLFQSGRI